MNAALERAHAAQQPRRFCLHTADEIVAAIRELPGNHANLRAVVGAVESMAAGMALIGIGEFGDVCEHLTAAWAGLDDCYARGA